MNAAGEESQICVSMVIPCHNEEEGIEQLYTSLKQVTDSLNRIEWEIICVDDGSADATLERLKRLVAQDNSIIIIELSRNFGKEAALTAGIDAARGHAVILFDADLQDPPEIIWRLIAE